MRRTRVLIGILALAIGLVIAGGSAAYAYWSYTDSSNVGTASGSADALPTGSTPNAPTIPAPNSNTVTVTFARANSTIGNTALTKYQIIRYPASGGAAAATFTCTGNTPTISCTESNVPDGSWKYTDTPAAGNNWLGNESGLSASVSIDATPPVVTSINRISTNPTNASSVQWSVTFSESVTGVGTADFALANTGLTGPSITGISGSGASYTVTANTGSTGTGTLGLNLVDDDSIADAVTNKLGGTGAGNGDFSGQTYSVDRTPPTVSSITRAGTNPTNIGPLTWTVTFSEPVSNVTTARFGLVTSNVGGTAPSITSATPSGSAPTATWTVSASTTGTTGQNNGSIGLNLTSVTGVVDAIGNGLSASLPVVGQTYTFDTTVPTRTAMVMQDTNANGKVDRVAVTYSENLSVSPTGSWTLNNVPSGGPLGTPTISGNQVLVEINEGAGAANTAVGSFTVALTANPPKDLAGNSAATFGATAPTDGAAPAQISIQSQETGTADGKINRIAVTFSENLAAYSAGTTPWTISGAPAGVGTAPTAVAIAGGTTANLTVNPSTAVDTAASGMQLALATNATGIRDAAGNLSSFGATNVSDGMKPIIMSATSADLAGTAGRMQATDTISFTFSEPLDPASVPATATVTEQRSGGTNLTIAGIIQTAGISNSYVNGNGAGGSSTATVTLSAGNTTITLVLGTVSPIGGGVATGTGAVNVAPSATLADTTGNTAATTVTASVSRLY